jgi:hypothetical protein
MTPAKLALQDVIQTRLSSRLSDPVGTDPGIVGVEIGDDDETQSRETTSSVHTDVAHTIRCRARSEVKAKSIAQDVVDELTDRSDLPDPTGFHVLHGELTGHDMRRTRRVDGPDYYEDIIILTYRVSR